jgi:hypothetical protein
MPRPELNRRDLLTWGTIGALSSVAMPRLSWADASSPRGKADACILLWLGGGAAQLDTFDPKRRGDGKKSAGSYYSAIPTAQPGVKLCEHLPGLADRLDKCVLIRSLHHKIIDEHGAATNLLHTGRPISETIAYPSLGSIVSRERGPGGDGVPTYVVIGYPNVSRGPGFLGSKHGYVYLTDTQAGPSGLTPPASVDPARRDRRERLLDTFRSDYRASNPADLARGGEAFGAGVPQGVSARPGSVVEATGIRGRVRPALPACPAVSRIGGSVRRGRSQPQFRQRDRVGHP